MEARTQIARSAGFLLHKRVDGRMLAKTLRLRAYKADNAFRAFASLARLGIPQVGARLLEPLAKLVAQSTGLIALALRALL